MISLKWVEWYGSIILFVPVYFLSVPLIGYVQAWVADKLGDSTAKDHGFLTLNPIAHFDLIGFIMLIWCRVGWGRYIPIEPTHIIGPWRLARIVFAYSITSMVSTILAFFGLVIAVTMFGYDATNKIFKSFFDADCFLFQTAASELPYYSTLAIIFALFLLAIVFINSFIAAISFILNGFRLALAIGFERGYKYIEYSEFLALLAPILVIFFFGHYLRFGLIVLILKAAAKIALFFGVSR